MQHEAGWPSGGGSSAGVQLQVDLGEAAGEDGGPDVVFAAHPHTAGQEVVAGSFGDEGRVAGHHDRTVAVAVVGGDVAGVSLLQVIRDLLHKLKDLQTVSVRLLFIKL